MCLIDRKEALEVFDAYVNRFDLSNPSIAYKKDHTKYVADNCSYIAEQLHCGKEKTDLAWTIGLLHDMGRFQQITTYHTFNDSKSVDHAALGNYILFQEHEIDSFGIPAEWYWIIRKAIFNHNKLNVSEDLSSLEILFANIIRDADKADIFRGSVISDFTRFNACSIDDVQNSLITERVYKHLCRKELIPFQDMETYADYFMRLYAMYFDISFPVSLQLIQEQGYFAKVLEFEFTNEENQKKFNHIKQIITEFTENKLNYSKK